MSILGFRLGRIMKRALVTTAVMLFLLGWVREVQAQYLTRWMAIGSLHTRFSQLGLWDGSVRNLEWEGIAKASGWGRYGDIQEMIGVGNIRGPSGGPPPSYLSLRSTTTNEQVIWPKLPFKLVSRRPATEVTVNGLPSFLKNQRVDEVDPSLKADRMFTASYGTWMGIERKTRVYAYSSEAHDDYYIVEMTLTNTGNTDQDEEIEEERTLEGVYFARRKAKASMAFLGALGTHRPYAWGADKVVARTLASVDESPDRDIDFTSIYSWAGWQNSFTEWDSRGGAIIRKNNWQIARWDTLGRLAGAGMQGEVHIYAPTRAMGPDETPWDVSDAGEAQPSTTTSLKSDWPYWGYTGLQAGHAPEGMWRARLECPPEEYPGLTWEQRMAQCNSNSVGSPYRQYMAYGPYTLEPGEHVTFVQAVGVNGLSQEAKFKIGNQYKRNWQNNLPEETPIEYDANGDGVITDTEIDGAEGDERMSKNMWVMNSRDSLFQSFRNAKGVWADGGLAVPQRPVQPKSFSVDTRSDRVQLRWTLYEDAPIPDSFAVYRTDVSYRTLHEHVATVEASEGERVYTYGDTDVERGVGYYYYVQSIDQTEESPAGIIPVGTTLRSNRYWTQTYTPAQLVRSPATNVADARVVPNPLHVNAEPSVRYPSQENRIGFLEIPGQATIEIYTELGELVQTIDHTNGSGDEYWNLTTESNQVVQSGIYMAVIKDKETGEQVIRRFVIIR